VSSYHFATFIYHWTTQSEHATNAFILSEDFWSRSIMMGFFVYLASDLVVGSIDYRNQITIVMGWIHHTFYILLTFWLLERHIPVAFCILGILEAPTASIALGQCFQAWNNDTLTGVLFVLTRIVLHAVIMFRYYFLPGISVAPMMMFIWIVHWWWLLALFKSSSQSKEKPKSA
jgi:hypothetical protein